MWIVIEGPDFVGKTSLVAKIDTVLAARTQSLPTITTREPGSMLSYPCQKMRSIAFYQDTLRSTETLLFLADRIQHEESVVHPSLARNVIVLQDRGTLSTYVYQVASDTDRVRASRNLRVLQAVLDGRRVPDMMVCCMADADVIEQRSVDARKNKLDIRDGVYQAYREVHDAIHAGQQLDILSLCARMCMSATLNTMGDQLAVAQSIADTILLQYTEPQ